MNFPYGPMDPRVSQVPRTTNPAVTPAGHGVIPPATAKAAAVARAQPFFIYFGCEQRRGQFNPIEYQNREASRDAYQPTKKA
ncbi:MAG: hypothetical protein LLG04_11740 [Parachlamydia sp.]|nr:hypothetical protein [Parachlamydia sp.]